MLIETENLTKIYRGPVMGRSVTAVRSANLFIDAGETVGLLGESGSGKSTVGLMLAGLLQPSGGTIRYRGAVLQMPYRGLIRQKIQALFQHPEVSFNPLLPLIRSLNEPYRLRGLSCSPALLAAHLEQFGLREEHLWRYPSELSGGELQRAALARILVLEPALIVLDEPTSMLDVITQAHMMNLLRDYQRDHGTAYLLISHDPALCARCCGRVYRAESGIFSEGGKL